MVTAIIQARLGSTRLPGKVTKKVLGKAMLEYEIERVKKAKTIDKIVIATTDKPEDAKIARLAVKSSVDFFCGSENDVLDRYYQAAKKTGAMDTIVRLTGDCPLIDPAVIDAAATFYVKNKNSCDYATNTNPPTYPDGMDVEVFSFAVLEESWQKAGLLSEREHVTPYIRNHPERFQIKNLSNFKDFSEIRLTLDNQEDLFLIKKITSVLYPLKPDFDLNDILDFLANNPKLASINRNIVRNAGYAKSLRADAQYIIMVLGGGLKKDSDGWRTTHYDEGDNFGAMGDRLRVDAAHQLYQDLSQNGPTLIICSGGRGQLKNVADASTVASVLKKELLVLGAPENRILLEENSNNTYQQLQELSGMVAGRNNGFIVSNSWHLPRIQAMIEHGPGLDSLKKKLVNAKINLVSAEKVLLDHDPRRWKNMIQKAFASQSLQERIKKEEQGTEQIKSDSYKWQ